MPIGWMTVLKLVPWGDVIKNAPEIADGAKKLWDSVGRKPPPAADAPADGAPLAALPDEALPRVQARLAEAEASIAQLHEQMQASSELIKALAEQNTELVRRVELHRRRNLWLIGFLCVVGAIAALNLAVTFSAA